MGSCCNDPDLAIDGGLPVRADPMPDRKALGIHEKEKIFEVLNYYDSLGLDPGYQGVFEKEYCERFCEILNGGFADAVSTGTASIFIALKALELSEGDEVLVSPITDPGTLNAVVLAGLRPKLVDAHARSFNTSPFEIESRLSRNTKALVLVHSIGQALDMPAIMNIAENNGLLVLEDCSQAHGASTEERKLVGSYGDIAAFSTMYRKASITGACGGVVYTRDLEMYRRVLAHADRGKPQWRDDFDDRNPGQFLFPALNFHSNEISCGIGIASILRLRDSINKRLSFVKYLAEEIQDRSDICTPHEVTDRDSPFIFPVFVDHSKIKVTKTQFALALQAEGIPLNPNYNYLVADWPYIQPYLVDKYETPRARKYLSGCFCLYLNENYGEKEVHDIVSAVVKVERRYRL